MEQSFGLLVKIEINITGNSNNVNLDHNFLLIIRTSACMLLKKDCY